METVIDPLSLRQSWPRPERLRPIVVLGAGDIVRDAHLPAYAKAGFPVAGVYDLDPEVATRRAREFPIVGKVFRSIEEAVKVPDAVFDVATPPKAHQVVLRQIPDGSFVIMQKPMGRTLQAAAEILEICRAKRLSAAVNFQLRFSPQMLAIRDFLRQGGMGELVDIEVHLNLQTPWDAFPFLLEEPRVEILIHSIHYLDTIRSFAGDPRGVYARTIRHPRFPRLASTKTSIILDYGDTLRACLSLNHCHPFGDRHQDATIRVEGVEGAAVARLGLLLDYPRGRPDKLEVIGRKSSEWADVPLQGGWFPDAFIGTISNLMRFANGEDERLVSPVEDAFRTMQLVEACYESDARGAIPMPPADTSTKRDSRN
jgi:predicted dehydrogenase